MGFENFTPNQETKMTPEKIKARCIELATTLIEQNETIQFPGLKQESYENLKKEDEYSLGYVTPIDDLVAKFETQGLKVIFGDPENKMNIMLLPTDSIKPTMDSLFPKHLDSANTTNPLLKELIELSKK